MKKLLLILLCLPMIFSCGDGDKTKKLEENSIDIDFKYINLPRLDNAKQISWRGLLKDDLTFKIYLKKGEVITFPGAYLAGEIKYGEINPGQTLNNKNDDFSCDSFCFKSLKSDYYYFWVSNRLSNGADDEIVDSITEYTFTID